MTDLEMKLLNGEVAGYCSSSDDEKNCNDIISSQTESTDELLMVAPRNQRNTGPKGVLNDYKIHKAYFDKKQQSKHEQIIAQAKHCTLSGNGAIDDLKVLRRERLEEIRDRLCAMGKVDELTEKGQFLDYIESFRNCWILIHFYDEDNEGCVTMNKVLNSLILRYSDLKLAKVRPAAIGMSSQFKENALPSLQVYLNEELWGNFIRITDHVGEHFTAEHLIHFLDKNGIDLTRCESRA